MNSSVLEAKTASEGVSSDGDEADIDIKGALFAILSVLKVELHTVLSAVNTGGDFSVHVELQALFLKRLMESFADLNIEEGANTIGMLHHSDFRAEASVNATELEADNTATNDGHSLGDFLELEGAS